MLSGAEFPGNTKDIIIIYEEDAEEWALYLRDICSHVVQRESILLYCLENCSLRHLELLSLNSYKCKLLILSNCLIEELTPKKRQFLEKILHFSESIVTLLCGMESSDQLYRLLNIPGSPWEISTEQEPEDYISVVSQIVFRGSEDYLEISTPTNRRVNHCGEISGKKETDDLEASRLSVPRAVVLPAEIPCENPGEIFILLKDEISGETLEVEFISNNKCIRSHATLWNKNVWCMKALDFPAGSVTVNVLWDGIIKATTEIKYFFSAEKAMECPFRVSEPRKNFCQNNIEELDDVLTSVFKHEIPYYEFKPVQTEVGPQKQYTCAKEFPTLLHCAAKFGLKSLSSHLLQCSGATWAAKMINREGLDLAHIAERHGHKELKKVFEDFAIRFSSPAPSTTLHAVHEINRNDKHENDYEEDIISFSTCCPSTRSPVSHRETWKLHEPSAGGVEESERAGDVKEKERGAEAKHSLPEVAGESSEYDDLYVFIPGIDTENNPQESLLNCRPPLPPPRPVSAASQLERPHFPLQGRTVEDQVERNQIWRDPGVRQEREEAQEETRADGNEEEEEENPYAFADTEDNEYDLILANLSIKKKSRSHSFIINRPPAPTPRPTNVLPKEETTPYIAQVFQQKAARRQSESDKLQGLHKKPEKARIEGATYCIPKGCLTAGQEELILLQEKVKNGEMSMDEALEKFKHWQMGKSGLEMIQQEKLRQLRDNIIGNRPEEENACDKLTIVHHPSGTTAHSENVLYSIPFHNKFPTRLQVEKEFGFCCRKDH